MNQFEPLDFRKHFPLLKNKLNGRAIVYFDNAATMQKPQAVIDSYQYFYNNINANVHRSSHGLSTKATEAFEQSREIVKDFIHANSNQEVIWTKGATEAINLVAQSYARNFLIAGDEIVLTQSEHHANIVPWQLVAEQTGAKIKVLPLDAEGRIDLNSVDLIITKRTKIVSFAHISNVLGRINPVKEIIKRAKKVGAVTLIDGAQAIAHIPVDVQDLDCDFYVFSAHKIYGPTGVGVLYGRKELLDIMPPYQGGGEMIKTVSFDKGTNYNVLPFKFEAGTPNIAGVIAFSKAIRFIIPFHATSMYEYELALLKYCVDKLRAIPGIKLLVQGDADIPVISFTLLNHHNHDVAATLDSYGIAIRSGHHCAMPLMTYLGINGCLRISLAPYNSFSEIDFFIEKLSMLANPEKETNPAMVIIKNDVVIDALYTEEIILDLFKKLKSWDSRHREIMMLSKVLTPMSSEQRNDNNLIAGCESLAWLSYTIDLHNRFIFSADSNAKVIRGLLVIVLAAYNRKTSEEIVKFNINYYFEQLGLLQHLSPSRGNGVRAIVDKIKLIVNNLK